MSPIEIREKEIFETLKAIQDEEFVLIGGYAVNAYTLPRFSVDCDIVVKDEEHVIPIKKKMESLGYTKTEEDSRKTPYYGSFVRYEKQIQKNFVVSMDILIHAVLDRGTQGSFEAVWVFENAKQNILRGKTITEKIKLLIVRVDALIAMKCVPCRLTDIRDIFMLIVFAEDFDWIRNEVKKRTDFSAKAKMIREKIEGVSFKNNLQGVYGFIDDKTFEKHKKKIIEFCSISV